MKKAGAILCFLLLITLLAACSDSEDEAGASSDGEEVVEAEIEDASYILSGQDDGEAIGEEQEGGLLLVNVHMKNVSDSSVEVYPDMNMQLYDGENQLDPSGDSNPSLDLTTDTNTSIGADKQKTMPVLFDVEKDKEYEINISPRPADTEIDVKDTTVSLDTSEYNDSLKALEDPGKALEAYVKTIYFDEDNSDYEKYVSADKDSLQEDAEKKFKDSLEMGVSGDISDSDAEKHYESFKQASAEEDEIEANVKGNANDQAIVELNYSALSYEDMSDEMQEYKEKYSDKHEDEFDTDKEDDYALSKFDSVLDNLEPKEGDRDIEVEMKKEDGKWKIDDSERDGTENIMRVFAEGNVM